MRKAKRAAIVAIALVLAAGVLTYSVRRSGSPPAIVGVVRATEIRVEPEVNGQLASIADRCRPFRRHGATRIASPAPVG